MSDIIITIIEDPSDILMQPRSKEKLFSALKEVLSEKGLIVSIDANESTGEEDTSGEREIPAGEDGDNQQG